MRNRSEYLFVLTSILFSCMTFIKSAEAITFAEYVYKNVRNGNENSVQYYLSRGYNINSVNLNGYSAICYAAKNEDQETFDKLRRMGARTDVECMEDFSQNVIDNYEEETFVADNEDVVAVSDDNKTKKYAVAGVLAAGAATGVALWLDNDDDGKHDTDVFPVPDCPEDQRWDGHKCAPIKCPVGQRLEGNKCVPIVCPNGQHLEGDTCVDNPECPEGTRLVNGVCEPIICPENTHLQGNICVADTGIDKDNQNDDDLYGINSSGENVYNLYSVYKYPDDEASISLNNKGAGKVFGVYGKGNVTNAFVDGQLDNDHINPMSEGVGNINITNEGNGNVYGIFSRVNVTDYKEATNAYGTDNGKAHGHININNNGTGDVFGIFGDARAYNTFGSYGGEAYGDITIRSKGNIYGIGGYAAASNATSPFLSHKVVGNINLYSEGDGNVYGMMVSKDNIPGAGAGDKNVASWFAFNAYSSGGDDVSGTINIKNIGNGDVFGMYGGEQLYNAMAFGGVTEDKLPRGHAKGVINIANYGDGDVYGMYSPEPYEGLEGEYRPIIANVNKDGSESTIDIVNTGNGVSTGMRGGRNSRILNSGDIKINNIGEGTAVGIYAESGANVENSGRINITREAYQDKEDSVVHSPSSVSGGTAYGIYAENGARVNNSGEIIVNGADKGAGIYLEQGATLENTGIVKFNGQDNSIVQNGSIEDIYGTGRSMSVNLNNLGGGEIILGKGGKFFAESLSGNMGVSHKVVLGSMKDSYVVSGALQSDDVDNLNMNSKSVMFEAEKRANKDGGYDVVLNRRNMNEIMTDKNLSEYFENNYNPSSANEIYDYLKAETSSRGLDNRAADVSGADVLPNFRKENAIVYRNLNRQFSDNLFNHEDESYIGGYKYADISTDTDGTLSGSDGTAHIAYGMLKNKADNGLVYGIGASVAHLESDYKEGSSRKSNIFGLWVPLGYDFKNGAKWYSKAYLGYADGDYDRYTGLRKYSSDFDEYQYGLSNEVRFNINLGSGFTFEPLAELNLFGVYADGYDEGSEVGALNTKKENMLSLEGGLGAYLSKQVEFDKNNNLTLQIGGIYYVEFMDPDEGISASMKGLNGRYNLSNKTEDGRAVFVGRAKYRYKDVSVYGNIEQETNGNKALTIDAGVEYNF